MSSVSCVFQNTPCGLLQRALHQIEFQLILSHAKSFCGQISLCRPLRNILRKASDGWKDCCLSSEGLSLRRESSQLWTAAAPGSSLVKNLWLHCSFAIEG
jgi:hypothetical protein